MKTPLVAFIIDEALYDDEEETARANEREFKILISDFSVEKVVFYGNRIIVDALPEDYCGEDVEDNDEYKFSSIIDRTEYHLNIRNEDDFLTLTDFALDVTSKWEEVNVLFSAHTRMTEENLFSPSSGHVHFPHSYFLHQLNSKTKYIFLNSCGSNQIDLQGIFFDKVVASLEDVDYIGLVNENWWDIYDDCELIKDSSPKSPRWVTIK